MVASRGLDLLAGSITGAGSADNANPASAQMNGPRQIAADAAGNLYIADAANHTIRMAAAAGGPVTTLAGTSGLPGSIDSAAGSPLFNSPRGIAVTPNGNTVYVYDASNKAIRVLTKGTSGWVVSTIPGTSPLGGAGYGQMTLDPTGAFLVIADYSSHCVRVLRLSDNTWGVYAGTSGSYGTTDNTTPALAKFDNPEGIAFNKAGTYLYVSEYYSTTISRIRMISWTAPAATGAITAPASGTVITLAGTATVAPAIARGYQDGAASSALFFNPSALYVDANDLLWVTDLSNNLIRTISVNATTPGSSIVATVAGTAPATGTNAAGTTNTPGADNGPALSAKFNAPNSLITLGGNTYISETNNCVIRKFDGTTVSTPVGTSRQSGATDATAAAARFNAPQGVAVSGGFVYVADTANNSLRKVSLVDGSTSTLATGFTQIKGVAVDTTGRIYVTDNGTTPAKAVLQIAADGTKTTVIQGLNSPQNLTVSPVNPNLLYVVDNNAILEVTIVRNPDGTFASASITHTMGVAATAGYADNATPGTARFKTGGYFCGLAVDATGNVFVADEGNSCIRKIAASTYAVTTIAGIGAAQTAPATNFGFVDGALGTNKFYYPMGLALDAAGNLYVADQNNSAIRKIAAADGTVSTLVGQNFVSATLAPNGVPVLYGASVGAIGGGASLYKPFGLAITSDGDLIVATNDGIIQITAP
jgi:sugar lactone lactonase YvrE